MCIRDSMWALDEKDRDFDKFLNIPIPPQAENGFVMPYGDCPLDKDKVGEQVYIDMLNRAQNYIYIMTPYLILDGELENALKYAAERGVDVRDVYKRQVSLLWRLPSGQTGTPYSL